MPGNAAHGAGIFVIYYSLDCALLRIISRRGSGLPDRSRRPKHRPAHAERAKNFTTAETVEGFVSQPFQSLAQHDETDVAVFGLGARACLQRLATGGAKDVLPLCVFK